MSYPIVNDVPRTEYDVGIPPPTALNEILNERSEFGNLDRPLSPYDYTPPTIISRQPVEDNISDSQPYLPQASDQMLPNSMDMDSVGPWASGNVDYRPKAALTGMRPIVDKYSVTRYSVPEWRIHNEHVLKGDIIPETNENTSVSRNCISHVNKVAIRDYGESSDQLKHRARHIYYWKSELENAIHNITNEIKHLENERQRLKLATGNIMVPDSIARECLNLRGNRLEPDLVQDDPQEELIKESSLIGEIRRVYERMLDEIERQMVGNIHAKARAEYDWSHKHIAYETETTNIDLRHRSALVQAVAGATRLADGQSNVDSWEHFSKESLNQVETMLRDSKELRLKVDATLINAARDLRTQDNRVNTALAEKIACTDQLRIRLENQLRLTLDKIVETEILIEDLKDEIQNLNQHLRVAQTRLNYKNGYGRPDLENCREGSLIRLIEEVKQLNDSITLMQQRLNASNTVKYKLLTERSALEKDITVKRKSLQIDRDRCLLVRSHYPSATKLCGY